MKKLIITTILLILSISQSYAYELTEQDKAQGDNMTIVLEKYIAKKWEKLRKALIKQLTKIKDTKLTSDDRKKELVNYVINKLTEKRLVVTWSWETTKVITKPKTEEIKTPNKTSSWVVDPVVSKIVDILNDEKWKVLKDWIVFDYAEADWKTIISYYHMDKLTKDEIDWAILAKVVKPIMVQKIQTNKDIEFLRERSIVFSYVYKDKNWDLLTTITITPEDYNKAVSKTDLSSDEAMMKAMINEINKSCPQKIDEETQLDWVKLEWLNLTYSFTTINISKSDISDMAEFKKILEAWILKWIKNWDSLKTFKDKWMTIIYQYKDKNWADLITIKITPDMYR